ncbi:hypothetical protein AAG570_000377 [Ranatra chinensis]|uniref:Uncharacterized protein n=1 Tax=Ranatra chinensis TaxID=642074 RepID=A0ABD0YWW2_9HEMI
MAFKRRNIEETSKQKTTGITGSLDLQELLVTQKIKIRYGTTRAGQWSVVSCCEPDDPNSARDLATFTEGHVNRCRCPKFRVEHEGRKYWRSPISGVAPRSDTEENSNTPSRLHLEVASALPIARSSAELKRTPEDSILARQVKPTEINR